MSPRPVNLEAPLTGGMVTDLPAYRIGPQNSAFAQDGFSPNGFFTQRGGWEYYGTTADVADNLVGVYRAQFALADATRTLTGDDDGDIFIHNPAGSGSAVYAGTVAYLPRAMYDDELIWCAQDGTSPLIRYGGSDTLGIAQSSGTPAFTDERATLTGMVLASAPPSGSFLTTLSSGSLPPGAELTLSRNFKILEGGTGSVTLSNVRYTSSGTFGTDLRVEPWGYAFPAVGIYNAGTLTIAGNTATGYGVAWDGLPVAPVPLGVLIMPATGDSTATFFAPLSATTAYVGGYTTAVAAAYQVLSACPFHDVAAHKQSLWGTGTAQYPNRVYVGPPGWDLSLPPGASVPIDPTAQDISSNANDFLMDFVDVPSPYDGDHIVALLESPNPLLVLKRKAVYGVFGSFGGLSVSMIADGIGCIDIRSAWSYDEGQFWCGEGGIYWYANGAIRDLTEGKINAEWRTLTRDFDYGTLDYCSLAVAQGHLVVHITTAAGTIQRTYLCDLRDGSWQSRISNFTPRYMFSSRVGEEAETLLAVSNARQGRILDFAPALDGSGTAKDDAGSGPRLQFHTTSALAQANGIEGDVRLMDLDVHANIVDAGAAGSTVLDLSVVSGGGVSNEADSTKTLDAVNSDTIDRIDRHHYRVNRRGRLHQLRGEVSTLGTDATATKVELHQVVARVRDGRGRS